MNIVILCPSRGRPNRFRDMLQSALATATAPVRVHLMLDEDDPRLKDYADQPENVTTLIGARLPGPVLLDRQARSCSEPIIFAGADDIVFETLGWDDALRNALNVPGPMAVAPNDGATQKWTHFAVNRRWLEVVGHLTPAFEHFCVDTYVEQIAKAAGRWRWLKDVIVRHVHKKYDRALNDQTYAEKRVRGPDGKRPSDRDEAMLVALRPQIEKIAERVRLSVYETRWSGGFTTEKLRARLEELLAFIEQRAHADRAAGRIPVADQMDELVEVATEYVRLTENGIAAQRESIRVLEGR